MLVYKKLSIGLYFRSYAGFCEGPYPWATAPLVPQGRSQDFLQGGAQPSLAGQTISPARQMNCAHTTGDLSAFSLET